MQVLGDVAPPPRTSGFTAFGVFAGYLVLDALVGNTDRHPGNWALLESGHDGARYLAATSRKVVGGRRYVHRKGHPGEPKEVVR